MPSYDVEAPDKKSEGVKHDKGKLRVDLIPVIGMLLQSDVYTRGAKKYGDHNWRKGMDWSRIIGAMFRHMLWWMAGEKFDPEDGQHHLSSIAWCANTLMEYEITHPEKDDRVISIPPEELRKIVALLESRQKEVK